MSKDKLKKAERAESGKDAKIAFMNGQLEEAVTKVLSLTKELAEMTELRTRAMVSLLESEAELGTARARIAELEVSLSKISEAVKAQAEVECREPPDVFDAAAGSEEPGKSFNEAWAKDGEVSHG